MIVRFLFERWWMLCGVLVVAELICFTVWTRRRTRAAARATWMALGAVLALPLVSHLVVTPRERIESLLRDMARLIDVGDVKSLAAHLAADFEAAGLDRPEFVRRAADALSRFRVDRPSLRRIRVTFPRPSRAEAVFDVVCSVRTQNHALDRLLSRWQVTWVLEGAEWRVLSIRAIPSPLSPIRNLRDHLR